MLVHVTENIDGLYIYSIEQSGDLVARMKELEYIITSLQIELETYKLMQGERNVNNITKQCNAEE